MENKHDIYIRHEPVCFKVLRDNVDILVSTAYGGMACAGVEIPDEYIRVLIGRTMHTLMRQLVGVPAEWEEEIMTYVYGRTRSMLDGVCDLSSNEKICIPLPY